MSHISTMAFSASTSALSANALSAGSTEVARGWISDGAALNGEVWSGAGRSAALALPLMQAANRTKPQQWRSNAGILRQLHAAKTRLALLATLAIETLEDQGGVGAAEAKAVGHHGVQLSIADGFTHDRHVGHGRVEIVDVCRT